MEYIITGENNSRTILFVHGLGANLSQFENQHSFFNNEYKVISVNLRGMEIQYIQENLMNPILH